MCTISQDVDIQPVNGTKSTAHRRPETHSQERVCLILSIQARKIIGGPENYSMREKLTNSRAAPTKLHVL